MMLSNNNHDITNASLRVKINHYKKVAKQIEEYLKEKPGEWGRFQSQFNQEINLVFREIMNFEKENYANGREDKVYKLKRLFIKRIKQNFLRGEYGAWSIRKPYGYAGDFKIIEDIYRNEPVTTGFDRLFDNYFMMSAISISVRNRKDDFKKFVKEFIEKRQGKKLRIMVLASGPCREIRELFAENDKICKNVAFDCYDNEQRALDFAAEKLKGIPNVNFYNQNAIRIAFRKNINDLIKQKYDLIYSTGLFDYFEARLAAKIIANLRKILNPNGIIFIANVRDKYSNPSVHYMEWAGDWNLIYRSDEDFRDIFIDAGFNKDEIESQYEQQGILQYIKAYNK